MTTAIRRRPLLAVLIAGSLALTVGATTTLVSVADRALWRRFPFSEPQAIVCIENVARTQDSLLRGAMTAGASFAIVGTYSQGRLRLRLDNTVESVVAAEVSADLFSLLGAQAVAGRVPLLEDEADDAGVALLGEHYWTHRFNRRSVLGQVVATDLRDYRLVGVAPQSVDALGGADVILVRPRNAQGRHLVGGPDYMLGRLRRGIGVKVAQEELTTIVRSLQRSAGAAQKPRVIRLVDKVARNDGALGLAAVLGVLMLFSVGTLNAGFLYLSWLETRQMEFATKAALGASPVRLAAALAGEWSALAVAAAGAGFLLTLWTDRLAVATIPSMANYLRVPRPWLSIGCIIGLTGLGTGAVVLLGYLGIVLPTARRLAAALSLSQHSLCGTPRSRTRRVLVTMQTALGVALLCTATVMSRGFLALVAVPSGFTPDGLVAFSVWRPAHLAERFPGPGEPPPEWLMEAAGRHIERMHAFHRSLIESCAAVPGVSHVGGTSDLPLGADSGARLFVDTGDPRAGLMVRVVHTQGDYFAAVGTRLVRGRTFGNDGLEASDTVVLDETAALRLWPRADPVGLDLQIARGKRRRVIGVVSSIRLADPRAPHEGVVYVPNTDAVFDPTALSIVVRVRRATPGVIAALTSRVPGVDPEALAVNVETGTDLLHRAFDASRAQVTVFILFGGSALILCIAGVFGATTHWLHQRRREVFLRIALGASRTSVVAAAVRQSLLMLCLGTALGIAVGWALLLLVRASVVGFDPRPTEGMILGALAVAVASVGMAGIAAWRVTAGLSLLDIRSQ